MNFLFIKEKEIKVWGLFLEFFCKVEKEDERKFKLSFLFLKCGYKKKKRVKLW